MDTAFIFFSLGINFLALNSRDNSFTPPICAESFPSLRLSSLGIRRNASTCEEVAREDAGFVAASAGADSRDNVFVVDGIVGRRRSSARAPFVLCGW